MKLTMDEIQFISLFENMTKARTKDCVIDEQGRAVFIVMPGELGAAIGKKGANIQRVRDAIGKAVDVVEFSEDGGQFLKNILHPARVLGVEKSAKDGNEVMLISVDRQDRSVAIGPGGSKIKKARMLMKRHFGVVDVILK